MAFSEYMNFTCSHITIQTMSWLPFPIQQPANQILIKGFAANHISSWIFTSFLKSNLKCANQNPSIYFGGFQLTCKIIQYLIMIWFTKRKHIDLLLVLSEYEQMSKNDFSVHDRELNCVNLVLPLWFDDKKMTTNDMKAWFSESVIINPLFVKSKSSVLYIESLSRHLKTFLLSI